ncbi:MAG: Trk system potassium transporter TrkA [Lachnospiraceae bacterium]|nr:Trk system potassium transporter TrkA [Lachnospiraceae bacterium]
MQIIIAGCGKVGRTLVAQLSKENNNITVIDTDPEVVEQVSMTYDVMGIVGNGTSYSILKEAGLETADMVIAVTESDEVNLLCCVIAKQKSNCHTIARVRNPIYSKERNFLRSELNLSMTINPELEAAREIAKLLRYPSAIDINSFAKDRIDLLRFKIPKDSILHGTALKDIPLKVEHNILVCMVDRNDEITIPNGNFVLQSGDTISIIAMPENAERFFTKIGIKTSRVKSAILIGGGGISYYLTEILLKMGVSVKIIERSKERCAELNDKFPGAIVDCGDGTNQELLNEEHLENLDALVACTGMDEVNALLSMYAMNKVKKKVVTKLNHIEYNDVIKSLNLDSIVNPKLLTASSILQYVRAMGNSIDSNVETLYRLMDGRVEALEFHIGQGSKVTGTTFADMRIKKGILVAGIMREGQFIIPGGSDEFKEGDSVIIITTNIGYHDINEIIEK